MEIGTSKENTRHFEILSDDIRIYSNAIDNLFLFIFTSIGAILSFAISQGNPYFSFAGYMLLIPVRCRHIHYRDRRSSLVAYMSVFIAKNAQIPLYDYAVRDSVKLPGKRKKSKIITKISEVPVLGRLFRKVFVGTQFAYLQYFSYSALAFGCLVSYFFFSVSKANTSRSGSFDIVAAVAIVVLQIIVICIDIYYVWGASRTFDKYLKYWREVKNKIVDHSIES